MWLIIVYLSPRGGHNGRRLGLWISKRLLNVELLPRRDGRVFSGFLKGQPQPEHVPDDPSTPVHVERGVPPDPLHEVPKNKLDQNYFYMDDRKQQS